MCKWCAFVCRRVVEVAVVEGEALRLIFWMKGVEMWYVVCFLAGYMVAKVKRYKRRAEYV